MNKYYVYGLFDKYENCFYIGKGTDRRMYDHRKKFKSNKTTNHFLYCKLKSLQDKNEDFIEKIIIDNLSETDALNQEKILIEKYGRKINGGILCNFLEGGTQPPSVEDIKKNYGEEFYKNLKKEQAKQMKITSYNKGFKYKEQIQQLLDKGLLMKDVAKELKISRNLVSKYIKIYNIKYDDTKKRELEKERLKKYRESNFKTIPKSAKTYVIITPKNEKIITNKLVLFCKQHKIDYKNLRNTFNKFKLNGENSKCKGFYIKQIISLTPV